MFTSKRIATALGLACCLMMASRARADIILGAGDVSIVANDSAAQLVVVDLANSQTLAAGDYTASTFNYQFSAAGGNVVSGSVFGLLLTFDGTNYNVIATGDTITDPTGGVGSFTSVAFGGSDTFTLASTQTVYAGVYEENVPGFTQPIGIAVASLGSIYSRYNPGFGGGGPDVPVVGNNLTGGTVLSFPNTGRAYDFSVTVSLRSVPEPTSLALSGIGGLLGIAYLRRNRRRTAPVRSDA